MNSKRYDLAVVGAGPGGYVSAIRGAQLGLSVCLVEERKTFGGTCLNVGCIPSKALLYASEMYSFAGNGMARLGISAEKVTFDLGTMMERKESVVKQITDGVAFLLKHNGVKTIKGRARLLPSRDVLVTGDDGTRETIGARNILIATGSKTAALPALPFDGESVVSSTDALAFREVPSELIVVGAGAIGLELGSVWSRLGSRVSVVELMPRVLPGWDGQVSRTMGQILGRQGLRILLNTTVKGFVKRDGKIIVYTEDSDGRKVELSADKVLVAVGRVPNTDDVGLEELGVEREGKAGHIVINDRFETKVKGTSSPGIYAIGDATRGPMLAHRAEEEGVAVAELLAGKPGHVNYGTIPNVIYTSPEAASVGKTEEQLKSEGTEYTTGLFPFKANGRALTMGASDGFVKLLADRKTDEVLGVHIVGHGASESIAEAVANMEFSASAEDIARTVHAHPTLSESVKEAALAVDGRSIHWVQKALGDRSGTGR